MNRGFVDPLVLFLVVLPLSIADVAIDAYHALMAAEVDEYDYEAEVRRIEIERIGGDEERLEAAREVWNELVEAGVAHDAVLTSFDDAEKDEGWYITHYGYGAISYYEESLQEIESYYEGDGDERKEMALRDFQRQREMAIEAIASFEKVGIKERLQRAAEAEYSSMVIVEMFGQPANAIGQGSSHRSLWRGLNAAKIHARQQGDWDGYVEYHRLSLALARHWMQQTDSMMWVVGAAILHGSLDDPREQLTLGAIPAPVIRDLRRIHEEQTPPVGIAHVLAEQHAETLEGIDMLYAEGGVMRIDDPGSLWNVLAILLPRRSIVERHVDHFFEEVHTYSSLPPTQRGKAKDHLSPAFTPPDSLIVTAFYAPIYAALTPGTVMLRFIEVKERNTMEQLAIDLLMAIELYRAEVGGLPSSLNDLVPNYLSEVPLDPFDPEGGLLRYRIFDEPDESGRTYLLYSVGRDGVDNGGHLGADNWPGQALQKEHADLDYVINHAD